MAVGLFLEWSINSTHLRAALLATTEVRCSNGECSTSPGQSLRVATELAGQLGCQFSGNNIGRKCPAETSGKYINGGLSYDQIQKTVFFIFPEIFRRKFQNLQPYWPVFFSVITQSLGPRFTEFPEPRFACDINMSYYV